MSLEAICPVSSLATALPLTAAATAYASRGDSATTERSTRDELLGTSSNQGRPRLPLLLRSSHERIPPTPPAAAATGPIILTVAADSSPAAGVDIARYQNTITLAAATTPAPSRFAVPTAGQDAGGSGGMNLPQATPQPASVPTAPATDVPAFPTDFAAKIRPMSVAAADLSLGATATSQSRPGAASSETGFGSGTSSGNYSSSGSPAPDSGPILKVSGGGWGGGTKTGPNTYNDSNTVPIGARVIIVARFDNGGNTTTITWAGGTDVSNYSLPAANAPAPQQVTLEKNVVSTGTEYKFVADSKPRTYTITATASTGKSSTITFTTDGPTGTLSQVATNGAPHFNPGGTDPGGHSGQTFVAYNNPTQTGLPQTAGMYIKAQAKPSSKVGGTLMFFQIINAQRKARGTDNGVVKTVTFPGNGQKAADNGGTMSGLVGYPTADSDFKSNPPSYVTSWPSPVGGSIPDRYMTDTPYLRASVASNPTLLEVGKIELDDLGNSYMNPEKFNTYLMFQGESSVWVPLAQINWSWSIFVEKNRVDNNGNPAWGNPDYPNSPPAVPQSSPPEFGPTYTWTFGQGNLS